MQVPDEITLASARDMLNTLYVEYAKYKVQKVTNRHGDNDPCGLQAKGKDVTYAERFAQLEEGEANIKAEYGSLLDQEPVPTS